MSRFTFQARWKEVLVCTCTEGAFTLEFPMGTLSVFLPTEAVWQEKAPQWARHDWPVLKKELSQWCVENNVQFVIGADAGVFYE